MDRNRALLGGAIIGGTVLGFIILYRGKMRSAVRLDKSAICIMLRKLRRLEIHTASIIIIVADMHTIP